MKTFHIPLLMLATTGLLATCFAATQQQDICGDPYPSQTMKSDPMEVIEWLMHEPANKQAGQKLDNNPFIQDLENGKVSVDVMKNFIVQMAYNIESQVRNVAQGVNLFGTVYDGRQPLTEQRKFFTYMTRKLDEKLDDLQKLGQKFQITSLEQLIKMEPDPRALLMSQAVSETVNHADDVAELVAPFAVMHQRCVHMNQRIKKALKTYPAYKAWNLSDDDLKVFDVEESENNEYTQVIKTIIARSLRRDLTLCPLRRRMNQFNHAHINFWDAVQEGAPHLHPSSAAGF